MILMAMVGVDNSSQPHRPSELAQSESWLLLGAVLHSSYEPAELSLSLCHDDSTINVVYQACGVIIFLWDSGL